MSSLMLALGGCTFISAHENFKGHFRPHIGANINSPALRRTGHTNPKQLRSMNTLSNGNREFVYELYSGAPPCHYFYEVNPDDVIVGWRFEGTERSCAILP